MVSINRAPSGEAYSVEWTDTEGYLRERQFSSFGAAVRFAERVEHEANESEHHLTTRQEWDDSGQKRHLTPSKTPARRNRKRP